MSYTYCHRNAPLWSVTGQICVYAFIYIYMYINIYIYIYTHTHTHTYTCLPLYTLAINPMNNNYTVITDVLHIFNTLI
jgi:hypothetical protein